MDYQIDFHITYSPSVVLTRLSRFMHRR